MKSKKETVEWLLRHRVDGYGNLDLRGLDFGDFKGNICTSGIRCKGTINQSFHSNDGDVWQTGHSNDGKVCQSGHRNRGQVRQSRHGNGGDIVQREHSNRGDVTQSRHSNGGDIMQEYHSNEGNIVSDYPKVKGKRADYVELDGVRSYYTEKKEILGFTIYDCTALEGQIVVTNGVYHYHGYSKKDAIRGLREKINHFNKDVKPIIDKVKSQGYLSKQDYRDLTGACEYGVDRFCKENSITSDTLKINELIRIFKKKSDYYGADKFLKWFDKENNNGKD